MTLYGADLSRIQAEGFGALARAPSPELVSILKGSSIAVRRVYDVGCGAGVTTRALVEAGFDVTAVEPSPPLTEIARAHAPGATFVCASAYDVELEACDAVLAIGEALTYHALPGPSGEDADARVRSFFETVAGALAAVGRFVFDVIDVDGPSLDARGWRSEPLWTVLWETREDRAARRLVRCVDTFVREDDGRYRRAGESHHVRLFRERDLRSWLEAVGFDVETARAYGAVALGPRRVAFVATRR